MKPWRKITTKTQISRKWASSRALSTVRLHEVLCDRHEKENVALRYGNLAEGMREMTFAQLEDKSKRLAQALVDAGTKPGDRVAVMLPKGAEVYQVAVATSRIGAIYQPLFPAFGPEAVGDRVLASGASTIITDAEHREKFSKVEKGRIVFKNGMKSEESATSSRNDFDLAAALEGSPRLGDSAHFSGYDDERLFALIFSSGTTGPPKGVGVPAKSLEAFATYLKEGVGLSESSKYLNIADPGWAYGLYYNVYGPLYLGWTAHNLLGYFSPVEVLQLIRELEIDTLAAAPTAYRAIRSHIINSGFGELPKSSLFGSLRNASSAGEPLPGPVAEWFRELGVNVLNHYGQTENGMMCNHHFAGPKQVPQAILNDLPSGSVGVPMRGFEGMCILDEDGEEISTDDEEGDIAVKVSNSPSFWFQGYWETGRPAANDRGYYLTGDRGFRRTEAGNHKTIVFTGRGDDVITSAGYRIGPSEVEDSILRLNYVQEAGVIGVPHELKGEVPMAYVVVKPEVLEELGEIQIETYIKQHVRNSLAKHLVPERVRVLPSLPRTDSGKVKRFVLRQMYMKSLNTNLPA